MTDSATTPAISIVRITLDDGSVQHLIFCLPLQRVCALEKVLADTPQLLTGVG
jgi:hypothetical protein